MGCSLLLWPHNCSVIAVTHNIWSVWCSENE
jgi:hypothetical protein